MPTSSFTRTLILDEEAMKKIGEIQEKQCVSTSPLENNRLEEGREALSRFSPSFKKQINENIKEK